MSVADFDTLYAPSWRRSSVSGLPTSEGQWSEIGVQTLGPHVAFNSVDVQKYLYAVLGEGVRGVSGANNVGECRSSLNPLTIDTAVADAEDLTRRISLHVLDHRPMLQENDERDSESAEDDFPEVISIVQAFDDRNNTKASQRYTFGPFPDCQI